MRSLRIETENKTTGKTRSFSSLCLGYLEADAMWPGGSSQPDVVRPVWALFAGTLSESRVFMANLTQGYKASFDDGRSPKRLECLKSQDFQIAWQREEEGVLSTIFYPDLFRLDPGMVDPEGIQFILLTPVDWAKEQNIPRNTAIQHVRNLGYNLSEEFLEQLIPQAYLFSAYLDRRTRCPLIADGRFYLQLLVACLTEKLATFPKTSSAKYFQPQYMHFGFEAYNIENLGYLTPIAVRASHNDFEEILTREVQTFFEKVT